MRLRTKHWSDRELKQWLSEAEISTVVDSINQGSTERQIQLFNLLSPTKAETVFIFLEPVNQAEILEHLDHKRALALLERMEPDDRARLFYELTEESSQRFLGLLSAKERTATALLLNYPPETAGRIMSPFFMALSPKMTVEDALDKVRTFGEEAETIYVMPVVDESMTLQGTVELDKLVMTSPGKTIESLMTKNPKSFSVYADQEEIARFIQSTDCLAVPIIEENKKLVGIVTIDDAMDIMQQEETEDILRGGASEPLRKPYFSVSIFRLTKMRIIWLIFLAVAGALTVKVLNSFESILNQEILLALFIPLIIGIGGNTGSQSATVIVRALAMNQVQNNDVLRVAMRETTVGILLGLTLGLMAYFTISVLFKKELAMVVAFSLITICSIGALVGSLMPVLSRVFRLDPAVVSAPLVSTVIDAAGLLIYFMLAKIILKL